MSLVEANDITVTELPDFPDDIPSDAAFQGILAAYTSEGYEQGYARATRDLLALYPLLIEQFLHDTRTNAPPEVRDAIRDFGRFVERRVSKKLDEAGYVDGGLGI